MVRLYIVCEKLKLFHAPVAAIHITNMKPQF